MGERMMTRLVDRWAGEPVDKHTGERFNRPLNGETTKQPRSSLST